MRYRRKKKILEKIDAAMYKEILDGGSSGSSDDELQSIMRTEVGELPIEYMLSMLISTHTRNHKQRLRAQGKIEITNEGRCVAIEMLSPEEVELIDSRRLKHIAGEIQTRIAFNEKFGRLEEAASARKLLEALLPTDNQIEEQEDAGSLLQETQVAEH